jgi:hypothetical protein
MKPFTKVEKETLEVYDRWISTGSGLRKGMSLANDIVKAPDGNLAIEIIAEKVLYLQLAFT